MLSRFPLINFYARKSPYEYVHSVRIELPKMILVGTRITYRATGDAGWSGRILQEKTKQKTNTTMHLITVCISHASVNKIKNENEHRTYAPDIVYTLLLTLRCDIKL